MQGSPRGGVLGIQIEDVLVRVDRELGIVGASDDGVTFTEFPCDGEAYPYTGCAGWHPVLSHPENDISPFDTTAAGGDAFDLSEIGVARAHFIRIRDRDGAGFSGSTGFDLDAIAVVNGKIVQ